MMLESVSVSVMCLLVCFHQGTMDEDIWNVMGYVSESVVLQSRANPSWLLGTIRWSIYENLTYIALFQSKNENVDLFPLFKGRLVLNKTSGDLTIQNILSRDTLKYRVDLVGQKVSQRKTTYVQLSVQERLGKPRIRLRHMFLDSGSCLISLGCLSMSNNTALSWESDHDFSVFFWSGPQENSSESVLWTSFTPNRKVTFFCIAADDKHKESSNKSVKCTEPEPRRNNTEPGVFYVRSGERIIVGFVAAVIGVILGYLWRILYTKKYKDGHGQPSGIPGSEDSYKAYPGSENAETVIT